MEFYFKFLAVLILFCAITLFIFNKETANPNFDSFESYENTLNKFQRKIKQNSNSLFKAWDLISTAKFNLSYKLAAVEDNDNPPGHFGNAVHLKNNLNDHIKTLIIQGWQEHSYNQFVGDLIAIDRPLPDVRDIGCLQSYSRKLPQASVVIIFYNEAWSTLLRTIHSVLNRSPEHLLKEIILVDDFSSKYHLKSRLGEYILKLSKVTLIRAERREGLIRARILGAKHVTAPVVIFLDSHCECTTGWMEPLLDRIATDPTIVASPTIDSINEDTFEYNAEDTNNLPIGGFNWELRFIWETFPKNRVRQRIEDPVHTPAIAGGLFAIDRDFFEKLGFYDKGFDTWGAENLELSFKAWMCGGSLEIVPCSHVGHVFRKTSPYYTEDGSLKRNLLRLAEVWLDDYAKYYHQRIGFQIEDFGDVTEQKELRHKLQCKSFEWFLSNVYPELEVPDKVISYGSIVNMGDVSLCLDSTVTPLVSTGTVHSYHCHHQGGNQFWYYTIDKRIKQNDKCLDHLFNLVLLMTCRERARNQIWLYSNETKQLHHKLTQNCLKIGIYTKDLQVILDKCSEDTYQKWKFLSGEKIKNK